MSCRVVWALLVMAGCTGAAGDWKKAGADETTIAHDAAECHESARNGALRRYPYRGSSPSLGASAVAFSQQGDDNARAVVEASLFNTCMKGHGYTH
jgi:hypothetical protein